MKKFRKVWMVITLIVAVALAGWYLMPAKEEPRYEGKTVEQWFDEIPVKRTGVNGWTITMSDPCDLALKHLKKEAVPFLLKKMKASDSKLHNRVYSWLNRLSRDRIMSDEETGFRIMDCFRSLNSDAQSATPALISLLQTSTNLAPIIRYSLYKIDPEAAAKAGIK